MKKAGASGHDKARIVKLMGAGNSPEQISMLTSVRIEHVNAIIKQAKAGTLRIMGPRGLVPLKFNARTDYTQADVGQEENVEQRVAEHEVAEHERQESEALQRMAAEKQEALKAEKEASAAKDEEIARLKEQLANQSAGDEETPAKPRRRRSKAA